MKRLLILLIIPLFSVAKSPVLSSKAEIYVETLGPYQEELYSAFGHSAIRVFDRETGINIIYNYGVFDYDQPSFYLNFAKGFLNYQLARMDYNRFVNHYIQENRFVHEQALNLNANQKQRLFDFLEWNARPENKKYFYDYFYNNCSTKIRDVLKEVFKDSVVFNGSYIDTEYSIRDLTELYLKEQPWGDLGIDICLGKPMDVKASSEVYMFLPDYLESSLNHASILNAEGIEVPLVKDTLYTYNAKIEDKGLNLNHPVTFTVLLLLLGIFVTFLERKKSKSYWAFDISIFSIVGLLGWLLLLLWVATDHKAAANNFNLLWAIPLHFPLGLMLLKKVKPTFLKTYFLIVAFICSFLLVSWAWLPQALHPSLIPLVVLIGVRAYSISKKLSNTL